MSAFTRSCWKAILSSVAFTSLVGLLPAIGTETNLNKELGPGVRVEALIERRSVQAANDQTNAQSNLHVEAVLELSLKLFTPEKPEGANVWTNLHNVYSMADPSLNVQIAFDCVAAGTNLFLTYKTGSLLTVEMIPQTPSQRTRERFILARDHPLGSRWTNAVFTLDAKGAVSLEAKGTRAASLVWELQSGQWELDLARSAPEPERRFAYEEWCQVANEGGRWVIKRKHTEPMPIPAPGPSEQQ